jgi:peptidoglycan/LPS O-acetylase OafA/YrhL
VNPQHRDGLLAVVGVAALLAGVVAAGTLRVLLDPRAIAAGVAGALALECCFLRYPDRLLGAWERRGVPVVALAALLAAGAVAVRAGPWLLGAAVWGLLVYLGLLACVLAGLGNPLAPLARPEE